MEQILQDVDAVIDQWGAKPESLLQIMLDVNHKFNYLPKESLLRISERLRMPISQIYSVANFFKVFSLTPRGRTMVQVCTGTACHVKGRPSCWTACGRIWVWNRARPRRTWRSPWRRSTAWAPALRLRWWWSVGRPTVR